MLELSHLVGNNVHKVLFRYSLNKNKYLFTKKNYIIKIYFIKPTQTRDQYMYDLILGYSKSPSVGPTAATTGHWLNRYW